MSIKKCKYAENKIKRMKNRNYTRSGPVCPFYIIDSESGHCFWEYIANPRNQRAHDKEELAVLFGTTAYNIYSTQISALKKIKKALEGDMRLAHVFNISKK